MKRLFLVLAAMILMAGSAQADLIAYTSFEEAVLGGKYTDTLDASTNHALINNSGEAIVQYTSVGGELGFSSYYYSTGGAGLTDGDYVGVTDYTGTVSAYTDGTQGFQLSDLDGIMETTIDTVDLTGYTGNTVSMDLFVASTGWEGTEVFRASVLLDNGSEIELLNTSGSDIDELEIEGNWMTLTADLGTATSAQLIFSLESNAADEAIFVDNIRFNGTASTVPIPNGVILLGWGLIGLAGIKRKIS